MAVPDDQMERLRSVKAKYEGDLMRKANVVGVGIGYRRPGGVMMDELCIVASVTRKVVGSRLDAEDLVPSELDGVPVDVQVVGRLQALDAGAG